LLDLLLQDSDPLPEHASSLCVFLFEFLQLLLELSGCLRARVQDGEKQGRSQTR
jgi:hypothetical protein